MQKTNITNLNKFMERPKIECIFLIFGLIFGLLLVFITPPFEAADEINHFYRSYQISNFEFIGQKQGDLSGGYLPKIITDMPIDLTYEIPFNPEKKFPVSKLKKYMNSKINFDDVQFAKFENTVIYSPTCYIPQALGIKIINLINLSPLFMVYSGRILNLLVFLIFGYFAIRTTPICKWGFALLSLMPMTMFQAASLSADSVCFGLSFLLIAIILNCAFSEKNVTNKQIFQILILSLLLNLCKSAYFFIPFLFLLIPIGKSGSGKKYFMSFFTIIIVSAIINIIWSLLVKQIYVPALDFVNPQKQLLYMISYPQYFVTGLVTNCFRIKILTSFVGVLGWLDTKLPGMFILTYLFMLIFSVAFEHYKGISLSANQKIMILTIFSLNVILIEMLIYLSFNAIGSFYIRGIQGRYFIPIAPMLLPLFYNISKNKSNTMCRNLNIFLICFVILSIIITLLCVVKRYYI